MAFNANAGVLIKIGCSMEILCLRMPQFLDFVKTRLSSLYFRARIGKKWNGQVKTVQCSWSLIDIEYNQWIEFTDGIYFCHSNLYFIVQKIQEMGVFPRGTHIDIDIYISIHPIPPGFFMHFKKVVTVKPGKRAINCKTVLHQIYLKQFN